MAIRDFAVPAPRTGSIDAHSGYGRSQLEGQEIHRRIQERRAKENDNYQSELQLTADFEREDYLFRISGRMDGFFDGSPPRIEEIKSTFNLRELSRILSAQGTSAHPDHPYCLQLLTYGYFHWLKTQTLPRLSFHLVSTRNQDYMDVDCELDLTQYAQWLDRRLDELVIEAKRTEKRTQRRKRISENFQFPFVRPRPGQVELIESVRDGMNNGHRMLIQAPTGLGKTAGVLHPTLQEALGRGQKVIYVTPKNSQHSVAEDAVRRFQDAGSKLKSLTITAKNKICFKAEPLCNPKYCEYANNYYAKVAEHKLVELLSKKKKLNARVFRNVGEAFQVCPFELQLDVAPEADTIICDYNYVFSPRPALSRSGSNTFCQDGKPNLVIDEAHNLSSRAMDYYSPSLSSVILEKMRADMSSLPSRFKSDAQELLDDCLQVIISCRPDGKLDKPTEINPPVDQFLQQDSKLRSFLSRYLDSDVEISPKDVILRMIFYWSEFSAALEYVADSRRKEFFTTFHPHPSGGIVKITCCDASDMLRAAYDEYDQVVGFSATLKPFDYYARLSGLESDTLKTSEFKSPFQAANRKLLIIPQISTKFSDRERNYPRIAETIGRISELRRGNYFAFFPSFDFMERVLETFKAPEGFTVLRQERGMRTSDVELVLEQLRDGMQSTLLFAVQGGIFSEGVDYPGKMIIGAFVVGPPLPNFDLEREQMRKYYEEHYHAGFDYAYTFPAMAKAVQAAGRVIRSETDRGIIILMDNRFLQPSYTQSMPTEWFTQGPHELVSTSILKEISDFWKTEPQG